MPAQPRGAAAKAAANRATPLKSVPTGAAATPEPKKAPAKKAAPAQKPTPAVTPEEAAKAFATPTPKYPAVTSAEQRAEKAAATHAEALASGETRKCAGQCGENKPITAFPTTARRPDGTMGRGKICRACRDAGRKAAKTTPPAAEPEKK